MYRTRDIIAGRALRAIHESAIPGIIYMHKKWLEHAGGCRADFRQANLYNVDFSAPEISFSQKGADLSMSDFRGALLRDCNFSRSNSAEPPHNIAVILYRANFRYTISDAANFNHVAADGADFTGSDLRGTGFKYASLIHAGFRNVDASYSTFLGADLRAADFRGATLHEAVLMGVDLRGADLSRAILTGVNLCGADLRGANLHNAVFSRDDIYGAIFEDPDEPADDKWE